MQYRNIKLPRIAVVAIFLAASQVYTALAAEVEPSKKYRLCMASAKSDPDRALSTAMAWRDLGGGNAAKHCIAIAFMNMERFHEAADRLEKLAQAIKEEPGFKAEILSQSAQAWLLSARPERARAVLNAALKLAPNDLDLYTDRAIAAAMAGDYAAAVLDLSHVIKIDRTRADAFVFRASARRFMGDLDGAQTDIGNALILQPNHTGGLLERGILRRLTGDDDGARADWLRILHTAPKSEEANAARTNIEKLDVRNKP